MNKNVEEVTSVLMEEYFGIGSTSETALDSIIDDMTNNRIVVEEFDCTPYEMMQAIGNVLKRIQMGSQHESAHWQQQILTVLTEKEKWKNE